MPLPSPAYKKQKEGYSMTDIRFDFSKVSRVKDSLRAHLLEQYAFVQSHRQILTDDSLDYASAAGTATAPMKDSGKVVISDS